MTENDPIDPASNDEERPPARRDQDLLEAPIGNSGWRYRAARMPGHFDLFGPNGEEQSLSVGGEIIEVRPLLGRVQDREVLIVTDRTETIVRRNNDEKWEVEGTRPR